MLKARQLDKPYCSKFMHQDDTRSRNIPDMLPSQKQIDNDIDRYRSLSKGNRLQKIFIYKNLSDFIYVLQYYPMC